MDPKVSISAISGAIVAVVMWLVQALSGGVDSAINIPAGIESALTVIVMFVVMYLVPSTWNVPLKDK